MRCSWCEPQLDTYLEGGLSPRAAAGVAAHLRACSDCQALLGELRVIDALLATARTPGVAANFTASVVSATHATPVRKPRRLPLGVALLLYVAIAWMLAAATVRSVRIGSFTGSAAAFARHDLSALGAAMHAVAPATPLVAASVTVVLLVDLLLLSAIFYAHRRMRPLLALYLARGRRP
jgi:anti-sigma factor RsiW